jgi:hypothetical protein
MKYIAIIITLFLVMFSYPSNTYSGQPIMGAVNNSDSMAILKKELYKKDRIIHEKDSILYLWFNDYAYRVRVISGIEKDPKILKYELWSIRNKTHSNIKKQG